MPRKTIAGLEAEIERLEQMIAERDQRIADYTAEFTRQQHDTNVYLSYEPTGSAEMDAMLIVQRTLDAIQPPRAQRAILAWVQARYLTDDGG